MVKIIVEIVIPARYWLGGITPENAKDIEKSIADSLNLPHEFVKIKG